MPDDRHVTTQEFNVIETQVAELVRDAVALAGEIKQAVAESRATKELLKERYTTLRDQVDRHSKLLDGNGSGLATRVVRLETWQEGANARLKKAEEKEEERERESRKAGRDDKKMMYGLVASIVIALLSAITTIYNASSSPGTSQKPPQISVPKLPN